jgi:hypothetical protein
MANGLIDLQTDLKSLRYGNDKPYITKNIGDAPGSQIGIEVQARIDDTSRIAQMLIDKPGLRFIGNQALLQQVDVQGKLQKARDKKTTLGGKVFEQVKNTVLNTAKIVGSTLAQVPVNGTGTHFVYGFRTDTYLSPATTNSFTQFFGAGGVEGAPLALRGEVIPVSKLGTTPEGTQLAETTARPEQLGQLHIGIKGDVTPLDPPVIKPFREEDQKKKAKNITKDNISNALTGSAIPLSGAVETTATPGVKTKQNLISDSVTNKDVTHDLEIEIDSNQKYTSGNTYTGKTSKEVIGLATNGEKIIAHKSPTEYPYFNAVQQDFPTAGGRAGSGNFTKGEESIPRPKRLEKLQTEINTGSAAILKVSEDINVNSTIQDFRQGSTSKYSFDYNNTDIKRETRVNLGDQGKLKPSGFYTSYSNKDDLAIDKLNSLDIQDDNRAAGTNEGRDLAKFYFEIITPDGSKFLHFRAFIDSIDDSYNADWQGNKYVGRAENFYTYGGFERDISVSFNIAAATRSEMKPLYKKMVYLASATAPTYGGIDSKFMRGTVVRITVGSYLSQIPGVITSVKFNLIDGMPWEIAMQNPEAGTDDDVQELPMGLQCSVSFKAIHDFAPQTGLQHYFTNPKPENKAQPFF